MKTKAPQKEFALADEPFALVPERAMDGDRITFEQQQSRANHADAEQHQPSLLIINHQPTTKDHQ